MAKFSINVYGIKNEVIKELNEGNKNLKQAKQQIRDLEIPNDFTYKNTIKNYNTKIEIYQKKIQSVKKSINSTIKRFESIEKRNASLLNGNLVASNGMITHLGRDTDASSYNITYTVNDNSLSEDVSIIDKIRNAFYDAGCEIAEIGETIYNDFMTPVAELTGAVVASGVNLVLSILEGIGVFLEALSDAITILATIPATEITSLVDLGRYLLTDNKNDFQWITEKMWKDTMSNVSEKNIESMYNDFYKNNTVGKWLDKQAFSPFKSNGTATGVGRGMGEVVGIIGLTILTMGAGSVAAGAGVGGGLVATISSASFSSVSAVIATISGFGKYTEEKWAEIKDSYHKELYTKYKNKKITAAQYVSMQDDWTSLKNGISGITYGALSGLWEGVQWFIGGKLGEMGGLLSNVSKTINSSINVLIDTFFNGADTVIRSIIDSLTSDKSLEKSFDEQGGVKAVFTNVLIGLIGSVGGEVFEKVKGKNNIAENEMQMNGTMVDKVKEEAVQLTTPSEVAEFFNDPRGFIASKLGIKGPIEDWKLADYANKLIPEDQIKLMKIMEKQRYYTKEESDLLKSFSKAGGPVYAAYTRGTNVEFSGVTFHGKEQYVTDNKGNILYDNFESYVRGADAMSDVMRNVKDIRDDIKLLDKIIEESPPLERGIILSRNVNGLSIEGIYEDDIGKILSAEIGTKFNDKGYVSTSADMGRAFVNRPFKLQIEVPKGSKVAYIQSEVASGTGNWLQQEVLIGRNSTYELADYIYWQPYENSEYINPITNERGQFIVKLRLVKDKTDSIVSNLKRITQKNADLQYYNNCGSKTNWNNQIDLSDISNEMKKEGMLAKHIAEVRDINQSNLYKGITMPEHGIEHVENVLFNAMYIGKHEGLNGKQMDLLVEAAKFHDCGRGAQGIQHGIEGASNASNYLKNHYSEKDVAKIMAAIEYHAINDNQENLNKILEKYDIVDTDSVKKIANILKDADALDRARFPGNLNEKFLRTNTSKKMIKAVHQLHEIRGKNYIKNTQFNQDLEGIIKYLRKQGISNYEIAFWIKNQPNEYGGIIPVWKNIDLKIQKVIGKIGG